MLTGGLAGTGVGVGVVVGGGAIYMAVGGCGLRVSRAGRVRCGHCSDIRHDKDR